MTHTLKQTLIIVFLILTGSTSAAAQDFTKTFDSGQGAFNNNLRLIRFTYDRETEWLIFCSALEPETICDTIKCDLNDSLVTLILIKGKIMASENYAAWLEADSALKMVDTLFGKVYGAYQRYEKDRLHEEEVLAVQQQNAGVLDGMEDSSEVAFTIKLKKKNVPVMPVYRNGKEYRMAGKINKLSSDSTRAAESGTEVTTKDAARTKKLKETRTKYAAWQQRKSSKGRIAGIRPVVIDSFKVASVTMQFSHWVLGRVDVYGTIGSKDFHFRNVRIIPVASEYSLEKAEEEYLVSDDFLWMIRLGDVVHFVANSSLNLNEYHPVSKTVSLHADGADITDTVRKPTISSYFNIAIFSDLNGYLGDEQPNGKLQTEITSTIPIITRPLRRPGRKPIPARRGILGMFSLKSPPGRRYVPAFTLFKCVMPEFCISKFGIENRFLPVQYDYVIAGSDTQIIKHVNHINAFQYSNLWVGGRLNLLTIEGQNSSQSLFFNMRFRLMQTALSDSLTQENTKNVLVVNFEPELTWRIKLHKNFKLELGYSWSIIKFYNNEYQLSYGRIYDDERDNKFVDAVCLRLDEFQFFNRLRSSATSQQIIYTPSFTLRYNSPGKSTNGAFFRMQFPNNLRTRNAYLVLQIGIQKSLTSLSFKD